MHFYSQWNTNAFFLCSCFHLFVLFILNCVVVWFQWTIWFQRKLICIIQYIDWKRWKVNDTSQTTSYSYNWVFFSIPILKHIWIVILFFFNCVHLPFFYFSISKSTISGAWEDTKRTIILQRFNWKITKKRRKLCGKRASQTNSLSIVFFFLQNNGFFVCALIPTKHKHKKKSKQNFECV